MLADGLEAGDAIPILKRHSVYLWSLNCDGSRFAALFHQTWKRLPLGARRRILRHWRESTDAIPTLQQSPWIELGVDYEHWDYDEETDLPKTWAQVGNTGHQILFSVEIVNLMPDRIVCDLVAHELVHVLQCANGLRWRACDDGTGEVVNQDGKVWGSAGELEDGADDVMEHWGFSATGMDDWALDQGIAKVVNLSFEEAVRRAFRFNQTGRRY